MGGTTTKEMHAAGFASIAPDFPVLGSSVTNCAKTYKIRQSKMLKNEFFVYDENNEEILFTIKKNQSHKILIIYNKENEMIGEIVAANHFLVNRTLYIVNRDSLVIAIIETQIGTSRQSIWLLHNQKVFDNLNSIDEHLHRSPDFISEGNWLGKNMTIRLSEKSSHKFVHHPKNNVIAKFQMKSRMGKLFRIQKNYDLWVAPNFDCSFAILLVIAFELSFDGISVINSHPHSDQLSKSKPKIHVRENSFAVNNHPLNTFFH